MVEFININDIFRKELYEIYNSLEEKYSTEKATNIYFDKILNLKDEDYNLYKYIIGLMYIDNYAFLLDEYNCGEASLEDLEFFQNIPKLQYLNCE